VRLAFDLADGYLSDQSVVRKKYGRDGKYVESLEFGQAQTAGTIYTSAISAPIFKYWHYNEHSVAEVMTYSDIDLLPSREVRRQKVIAAATGAAYPSYMFDIKFRQTDTTHATGETLTLPVNFTVPVFLTAKGASMNISSPFTIYVQDSSGTFKTFNVTVNVSGKIKVVGETYVPKAADEFSIDSGSIVITGTDTSLPAHVLYTVTLNYSGDKVENKTGNFTGTDGFTANYTIDKDLAYYTKGSDQARKFYAYWDYPL
jgi:hypothetical protein